MSKSHMKSETPGNNSPLISIVSPVYRAELIVDELVKRIVESVTAITDNYEIILVEDGSPDNSWERILHNCKLNPHVVGIRLSRNFGQHHAITAGLDNCRGEWVVVMDCDLQDNPAEIPNLYREALRGFDIVFAKRVARKDSAMKIASSVLFYKAFTYLSGVKQDGTISNFGIFNRKVIQAINSMREPLRAFSPMARFVGFKKSYINVEHSARYEGKSSYNWTKLINLALDISIAYSDKPLKIVINLGLFMSLISMLAGVFFGVKFIMDGLAPNSSFLILLSVWLLGGLIIFIIGVVGLYLGKIFDSVKGRPLYFIDEKIKYDV